jgi:hypothetical protein
MHPVLIRSDDGVKDDYPVNTELDKWDGHVITSLAEITGLLE